MYTTEELRAMRDAEIEFGNEEEARVLQGIIDLREADEYAKETEALGNQES